MSLKVLYIIDSLGTGGAERDLAESLPPLTTAGVTPIVVALRRRHEGVEADLLRQGFDVRFVTSSGVLARVVAVRRIIDTEAPTFIHTMLFNADIVGRFAAIGTGVHVITSVLNTDYNEERYSDPSISVQRLWVARLIDGWTARHLTRHIHANSQAVKAAAIRHLRIPPHKITVIENGRDPVRLGQPSPERRRLARSNLGFADRDEILVNIGRQDHVKGHRYILEALKALAPRRPNLYLLIVGRAGNASSNLRRLCEELDIASRVAFLGHRNDVAEILSASDVFVFPSLYEGLPGAIMEAMALGLPIVASDIAPHRELLEEGRNAFFVRLRSSKELVSAIEKLLDDRTTARSFGEHSQDIFANRFTLALSAQRRLELYQAVLSKQL